MRRWFRYEWNHTDVRIPFGRMVAITLKWMLASIPRIIVSPASAESASGCRDEEQLGNEVNDRKQRAHLNNALKDMVKNREKLQVGFVFVHDSPVSNTITCEFSGPHNKSRNHLTA